MATSNNGIVNFNRNMALMGKIFIFLFSLTAIGCVSAKESNNNLGGCESSSKLTYLGREERVISDRKYYFGKFIFQNISSSEVDISLLPVNTDIALYPKVFELQNKSASLGWQPTDVILEELERAPSSISVSRNASIEFLVNSGSFSYPAYAKDKEFRLVLTDKLGCKYNSNSFEITSDD